jgi:6-phosphogluconolactonase
MSVEIRVLDDPDRVCAELLVEAAQTGRHLVLTGGSGPKPAYGHAVQQPEAWAGARLWFSDERCVPPDDERSNYGMVDATVLGPIASAGVAIGFSRRMLGELGPEQVALENERVLAELGGGVETIRFDPDAATRL